MNQTKSSAYSWTPEKLRFYIDSLQFAKPHKKILAVIQDEFESDWRVADIGCGPAFIDFDLAEYVTAIDAIDVEPLIIDELVKEKKMLLENCIEKQSSPVLNDERKHELSKQVRDAGKIMPILKDAKTIVQGSYDAVIMAFFPISLERLIDFMMIATKKVFFIVHNHDYEIERNMFRANPNQIKAPELEAFLEPYNFKYKKHVITTEFGQPFRCMDDVHLFLNIYARGANEPERSKIRQRCEDRIEHTDSIEFPYFLSRTVSIAVFSVEIG
ncbi:MAG: hypothetical protein LBN22_06990 [Clostridiales Family XIII bacterium]|jgi:SAM-dependent methyltransferase|nr:hypothetical protein [Clostridiales Family XIII bacterium]